jgi:hypothetical protein
LFHRRSNTVRSRTHARVRLLCLVRLRTAWKRAEVERRGCHGPNSILLVGKIDERLGDLLDEERVDRKRKQGRAE